MRTHTWTVRTSADLGRAIGGVRAQRGLTQAQLSELVDVNRGYLAKLEAGLLDPLVLERSLRALRRMGATVTVTLPEDDGPPG